LGRMMDVLTDLGFNYKLLSLVRVFALILFLAHMCGCLWHWITLDPEPGQTTWLTWYTLFQPDANLTTGDRYVLSVHFGLITLSTSATPRPSLRGHGLD
jgi:hypothetical protein